MIISDEDDAQKIKDPPAAAPTLRYPERAASRRRPFSPLPDYETSQALAFRDLDESQVTLYKPPPRRRILDSRLWRVAIISLVVYIFLTLVIGVPIIVNVRLLPFSIPSLPHLHSRKNTRTTRNTLPTRPPMPFLGRIKTSQAPSNQEYFLSAITGQWSSILTVPLPPSFWPRTSLCPLSLLVVHSIRSFDRAEQYVSPNGQFSLTSNASCSSDLNNVQGAFYTGINPDPTVQDAVLSVMMQSSSPNVFNHSFVCFALADNFTDLALYVSLSSSYIICYSHSSRLRATSRHPTISYTTSLFCSRTPRFLPRSTPLPRFYRCSIKCSARLRAV